METKQERKNEIFPSSKIPATKFLATKQVRLKYHPSTIILKSLTENLFSHVFENLGESSQANRPSKF